MTTVVRASPREFTHMLAYLRASRELNDWISGARALALLSGALDSGVLDELRTKSTPQQIASATNMDPQGAADLCLALEAHGVAMREGECYRLTPNFALLASPTAAVPLADWIRQAMVMVRALQASAPSEGTYNTIPSNDVLAMAEGAGISALSSAPHISPGAIGQMLPEVEARWLAGVDHLEVGCGVGNALLGIAASYPRVTAVGIEIDAATAAEAERRAGLLGLTERVQVRRMDACELRDEEAFDTIQWSQFFFPASTRPIVLQAMRRALKPGGYLFMPLIGSLSGDGSARRGEMLRVALRALGSRSLSFMPYANDLVGDTPGRSREERRYITLQRLLFGRWRVPIRTVSELRAEVERGGFRVLKTMHSPVNQFVLTRGFLLAQRGTS